MPYSNIDKPSKYFNTVLYTGNGSTQSITGVGFSPDMVWTKKRSGIDFHAINDKVRGALKIVFPNTTDAEDTSSGCLTSFDSDGFSLGNNGGFNANGATFASWNWKANGAGVSNNAGTISSTVSANTTSGFSIVSYTGTGTTSQTVGHGLGVAPAMIIIKNRSAVTDWRVYHKSLGVNGSYPNFLELDLTTASNTGDSGNFASVPTSSVFGVGNYNVVNGNGNSMIAYCFAEIKGYSKAFSYTGNGSTDGTYVHLGFRPAWVMIKQTSASGEGWEMADNKRSTFNVISTFLRGNSSATESTNTDRQFDFVSNGIKLRGSHGSTNGSGATYIGFAVAENPFVSSKGVPVCAR